MYYKCSKWKFKRPCTLEVLAEFCINGCFLFLSYVWDCQPVFFGIHECLSLHVSSYTLCVLKSVLNGWMDGDTAIPTAQCLALCLWLMCSCLGWQCQREGCTGTSTTAACWFTGFHFYWCKVNLCGRSAAPECTLASFNPHPSGQSSTTQEGAGIHRGYFLESGDVWIHLVIVWFLYRHH